MSVFVDDRALLDAFRVGARDALTTIYYHYVDEVATLVRLGFHIDGDNPRSIPGVRTPDLEAELVQETFARAFNASARLAYDGVRPYRAYLLRIAKNLLVDRLRKKQEVSLDAGTTAPPKDVVHAPALEDTMHWERLVRHTRELVSTLDPESQTFVRLRFEDDKSQEQVAIEMKITRRRVRTLEQSVQAALVKHLKRQGN